MSLIFTERAYKTREYYLNKPKPSDSDSVGEPFVVGRPSSIATPARAKCPTLLNFEGISLENFVSSQLCFNAQRPSSNG